MTTIQPSKPSLRASDVNLVSSLRALPAAAWILCLGMFLNKFGAFVVPFLALYLTRLGYTLADAGLAIGAYGVGNFIASLLGGHLADTIGRRKTIVLSMFFGAGTLLLLSQARSLPVVIAFAGPAGLAGEFYRPACSALLADLVPPGQRVTAFAAFRLAFNAGWAFGPATAGLLAAKGFFWLFVGDAATSILFGLLAMLALPRDANQPQKENHWIQAVRAVRQDRRFHQIMPASFCVGFVSMQMSSSFGVHVIELGFSAAIYGALISLNGTLVVFCELPLTTLTRRFPARQVLAASYVLIGLGFALIVFASSVAELVVCVIVFTLGEMVALPVSAAFVANLAPEHLRGRHLGVFGLNWALALIIGPGFGLKLLALNPTALWLGCGALGVIGAAIISKEVKMNGTDFMASGVTQAEAD